MRDVVYVVSKRIRILSLQQMAAAAIKARLVYKAEVTKMHRCLKTGDDRPEEILKKRLIVDGPIEEAPHTSTETSRSDIKHYPN
ncbi:hypothetical protein YC2023_062124 [Brassica napus]